MIFVFVMHQGEHVRKVVKESGQTVTALCKKLHKSRRWLYDVFHQAQIGVDTLYQLGNVLHYDFISDFPEYAKFKKQLAQQQEATTLDDDGSAYWRDKYYGLLEKYSELLAKEVAAKENKS